MGKARRRRHGAGKRTNPIGLEDGESDEARLMEAGQQPQRAEAEAVSNIIEQLQSGNPEDRVSGCQSLANFCSSPAVMELALQHKLVRIAGPLLLDEDEMVRIAAAGSLRNLSGFGPDTAECMVDQDLMTPLTTFLNRFQDRTDLSQPDTAVLTEAVVLLWNLLEASPTALAIFNREALFSLVLRLLNREDQPDLVLGCLNLLAAASDCNPAVRERVNSSPGSLTSLERILVSAASSHYTRVTCAVVLVNLSSSIFSSPLFPTIMATIAESLTQNTRQTVSSLSSSCPVTEDQGMEVEGAEDAFTDKKATKECEEMMRWQQASLQLLANLSTLGEEGEEEEEWRENPSDEEDFVELEGEDGENIEDLPLPVSPALVEAVVTHNLVASILERANSLPENVLSILSATGKGRSIIKNYEQLQASAFLCLSNLTDCLSVDDFGGAETLYQTWTSLGALCLQSKQAKNWSLLEAGSACMRSVTAKLTRHESPAVGQRLLAGLGTSELETLVGVAGGTEVASVRVNFVHIVGELAGTAARNIQVKESGEMLGVLGTWLVEVGGRDSDLRVVAEALDKTFDAFGEDDTDDVFAACQLLPKLRQLSSGLKAKLSSPGAKRQLGGEVSGLVSMARLNLARFIKYKEKRPKIGK